MAEAEEVNEVAQLLEQGNALMDQGDYEGAISPYTQALKLDPNNHEALLQYGNSLFELERYEDAISPYTQALKLAPNNPKVLLQYGNALYELERHKDAVSSYNRATELNIDNYQIWFKHGNTLHLLGCYEAAVLSYNKILEFDPENYLIWYLRSVSLSKSKQYEEAIKSFDITLTINANLYTAWVERGAILCDDLNLYEEAIQSFRKALELKPDYYLAWHNYAIALKNLKRYEDAVENIKKSIIYKNDYHSSWKVYGILLDNLECYVDAIEKYDRALEIDQSDYESWSNSGAICIKIGKHENAISRFDKSLFYSNNKNWRAWVNKGSAYIELLDYATAIFTWEQGINALGRTSSYACGTLHLLKGRNQYSMGPEQSTPWAELFAAEESFDAATQCFKIEEYPELHLEACAGLLRVCYQISDQKKIHSVLQQSTEKLNRLLATNQLTLGQKQTLRRKFSSFNQHRADVLATENLSKAVEHIEACKHLTLDNLRSPELTHPPVHIPYNQIQQLLTPTTAIIYWHFSPSALTTFILKLDQAPILLHSPPPQRTRPRLSPETTAQRQRLEEVEAWMQLWKHHYQTARKNAPNPNSPWRAQMPAMLYSQLRDLLDITRLHQDHLQAIDNIILIPHRDLHLLPLHVLFPQRFTITYLPSAQTGLNLRQSQPITHRLLNIEDPATDLQGKPGNMLFATLESQAIAQLYRHTLHLTDTQVTHTRLTTALTLHSGCLHFTGHSYHDFDNPLDSALALAGDDRLTLKDLFQLDLSHYHLVCLSACETGLTSPQSIVDEYIGIVSGFLAAGVQTIVSTLWTVDEISSALLMIRFHQLLKTHPPAIALSQAQDWLKTSTYHTLIPWLQDLTTQLAKMDPVCAQIPATALREMQTNAQDQGLDHTPYDHPYYWAGYTLTGLPSPRS